MKAIGPDGFIDGLALFYEVDDNQLDRIKRDNKFYLDKDFISECNKAQGDNAHFFGLYSTGNKGSIIYKQMKMLLKKYKTVSWWDRNLSEFKIVKGG